MMGNENRSKLILLKCLAFSFIALFVVIIAIANRGEGSQIWGFLVRHEYGDKVGHLLLVGILSFLGNLAFEWKNLPRLPRFITTITFILFLLLTLEELSQAFIPSRSCDILDWFADLCGLALGQIGALQFRSRFLK